jgi:hypothetical protein
VTAPFFWHGCNYPWSTNGSTVFYGLDFGANIWGSHLGVSTRRDAVAADFAAMARLGFTVARWFVLCDGRSGIVYDQDGLPQGSDPFLLRDMDAALEIAGATGIRLALVMLDHRWMFSGIAHRQADPVTGERRRIQLPHGRARVLLRTEGHDALFACLLEPIVERYGPRGVRADLSPAVAAYELMNEPDFVVNEWIDLSRRVRRPLPFAVLADLVARFSDVVHARSSAMTTLGGARVRNLEAWMDARLGLDLLQVHSYPDVRAPDRDIDPFGTPAAAYAPERPLLLGEFPGNGPHQHPPGAAPPPTTLGQYLEFAVAGGYVGAWPWSFSGTDAYGRLPTEPLLRFAREHPELVNARCVVDGSS